MTPRLVLLAVALVALPSCAGLESLSLSPFMGCSQVMPYTFGERLRGSITESDCTFREDPSRRVDYYELRVSQTIDEARLRAGDEGLDPMMILYTRSGVELDRNDDITPVLNTAARVQRRLEPGTYIIAVVPALDGDLGAYELSATVERD